MIAIWCSDCGMSLSLSESPVELGEDRAICDICRSMAEARLGDEELEDRAFELREQIEVAEEDLKSVRDEIYNLKERIEELEEEEEELLDYIGSLESSLSC